MPSWLPIALTIVFGTLTIVMNAIINIKIKFVPSADVAKADLKQLALRVIQLKCCTKTQAKL